MDYLFEAKWAGLVSAKEMDIFASKVQRKLDNTLGFFPSKDGSTLSNCSSVSAGTLGKPVSSFIEFSQL